jgi:hypothetical protein
MKKFIVLILFAMGSVGFGAGSRLLPIISYAMTNTKVVKPTDNLQTACDWLEADARDAEMGALASGNRRTLVLAPGTYSMSYTVLMDTDYVDIMPLVAGTVTITKTGNSMGIVLLPDTDAVNFITDDREYIGSYGLKSVANNVFKSYVADEIITKNIPVTGLVTNVSELSNEGESGRRLIVQYKSSTHLFGSTVNKVYSSVDGATWAADVGTSVNTIHLLWAADDTGNCVMTIDNATTGEDVYYGIYAAGALTFTRATIGGENFTTGGTTLDQFNFKRLASGALLLSEYGTAGRKIYRSNDLGHTWAQVFDAGDGVITHFHVFGQLLRTGRIIATSGDNTKAISYVSDDDGLSWSALYSIGTKLFQPVCYTDIGHSSKLLAADDSQKGLFLLDVYTGLTTQIFKEQDRRTLRGFFWSFAKNGNTIYASTYDTTTDGVGTSACIYATDDLVNWSPIYRIAVANASGARRLFWFEDKIHGDVIVANAYAVHLALTPPIVGSRIGVRCEQALTNELSSAYRSSFEDASYSPYVTSSGSTITQVTSLTGMKIPNGSKAVRVVKDATSALIYFTKNTGTYGLTVSEGDIYAGSVMLGVPITGNSHSCVITYCKSDGNPATNFATLVQTVVVHPGEWVTVRMPPITVAAGDSSRLGMSVTASVNVSGVDLLFDEVQLHKTVIQPSSWQVGGTVRAKTNYDYVWHTDAKLTHIFTFLPLEKSEWYDAIGGNWYIRSWYIDSDTYAELYYDSDDQKFYLYIKDGAADDTLSTAAQVFRKGHPIIFCVQIGDDGDTNAHLSIGDGRAIETVNGAAEDYSTGFASKSVLVRWGDKDSAGGLNGWLYDFDFSGELAAASLVTYINGKID